jgi:hypothetical protein
MRSLTHTVAALGIVLLPDISQSTTVYTNNFDGPAIVSGGISATFSGPGVITSSVFPYDATYGNFYRSDSDAIFTTLSFSNLPAHTSVSISYILGFMESWDSRDGFCCAPDNVDVYIDGAKRFSYTYNNVLGTIRDIGSGTIVYERIQFDGNTFPYDTIVDMATDPGYTFLHSSSTLQISWIASGSGWQAGQVSWPAPYAGGTDEGYALDNISVSLSGLSAPPPNTVISPASVSLLVSSLAGLGALRRRFRAAGGSSAGQEY